ncbi:MAG: ComEC/Rec2 family competence protein [Bdellovibrionaceae bacterium]|nr:ComEC/Rec2 family competence protein [Pseudobdellovibrionaceae bacterium]
MHKFVIRLIPFLLFICPVVWVLIFLCMARCLWFFDLHIFTNDMTYAHQACLDYIHWRHLPEIFQGLICGSNKIGEENQNLFLQTGLYHLIVVSGSHLVAIERLCEWFLIRKAWSRFLVLISFAAICQFQPPIVRALAGRILNKISRHYRLSLRPDHLVLSAGLFALLLFPQWIASPSLQLSWIATLVMSLPLSNSKKIWLCVLYITPIFGGFNISSGINNMLFAVFFDIILFPASLIALFVPYSEKLVSLLWDGAIYFLKAAPHTSTMPLITSPTILLHHWIYIFILQLTHSCLRPTRNPLL